MYVFQISIKGDNFLFFSFKEIDEYKYTEYDKLESLFSKHELNIIRLISMGLNNNEIAEKLFISKRTVDKHKENLLHKTNTKNSAHLLSMCFKNKIIAKWLKSFDNILIFPLLFLQLIEKSA